MASGELTRRLAAGRQGRDRLDAAREWADRHGGALDGADLQEMADGPILDPLRLALPLGRCSEAEMRRRER